MARVQGTVVNVQATFPDPVTGELLDPPDVQITVTAPNAQPISYTASSGAVAKVTTGTYAFGIDTMPAPGTWKYEVASIGGQNNVRKQRSFDVRPKMGP